MPGRDNMTADSEKNGIINVRPIFNGEVREIEFSFTLPEEDYGYDDITFDSPISVSGKVTRKATGKNGSEDYTELVLEVCADIRAECARCLEEITERLEYTKTYGLTKSTVSDDSEDYVSVENGSINVLENARSLFLLNLPMRFLCDEDCKGICFECGKNLNDGPCGCEDKKEVDPRLAALLDLVSDEE